VVVLVVLVVLVLRLVQPAAVTAGNLGALFALFFASLLHACLALYVEQVNERKMVCVCGARKSCFEASSFPAPTSIFGARLDHGKAAGTYQISHTDQAPARVVWMTSAC
jgi:hypothetical protein